MRITDIIFTYKGQEYTQPASAVHVHGATEPSAAACAEILLTDLSLPGHRTLGIRFYLLVEKSGDGYVLRNRNYRSLPDIGMAAIEVNEVIIEEKAAFGNPRRTRFNLNSFAADKEPELRTYELWVEGFSDQGGNQKAHRLAVETAASFDDAVRQHIAKLDPDARSYYKQHLNEGFWTCWLCRIFDNEHEARKSFG